MVTNYFKSLEEIRERFYLYVNFFTEQAIMYDSANAYTGMRSAFVQYKEDLNHSFNIALGPHTCAAVLTAKDEAVILNFLNRQARIFIPEIEDSYAVDHVRYHTYMLEQALKSQNADSVAFKYLKEFVSKLETNKEQNFKLSNNLKIVCARACLLQTLETSHPAVFSWLNTGDDSLKQQALIAGVENPLGMKLRTLGGYVEKTGELEPWSEGVYTSITDMVDAFTYHLSYEEADQKQFTLISEVLEEYVKLLKDLGGSIFDGNSSLEIDHPWIMREAAVSMGICTRAQAMLWYERQETPQGLPRQPNVQS